MNLERKTFTDSSIQTHSEISSNKQLCLKTFLTILCLINSIIGFSLDKNLIFNNDSKFKHILLLKIFIYGYTYIILTALCLGFIISLLCYIIYKITNLFKRSNYSNGLNKSLHLTNTNIDNSFSEDDYNFINFSIVVFVFSIILLYTISILFGSYLLYEFYHNPFYNDYKRFFFLYLFTANNVFLGLFLFIFFIYIMFFIHVKISNRQKIILDEEFIKGVEKEIEKTHKISGTIPNYIVEKSNKTIIKKQDISNLSNSNSNAGLNVSVHNRRSSNLN